VKSQLHAMPRSDGADGAGSTNGAGGAGGAGGMTEEARRAFIGGAKVGAPARARAPRPFDGLDPDAPNDKAMNFKTNSYERALFNYLAGLRGTGISVQQLMRELAREAALAEIRRREG
jgi:hypothetical protein